MSDEKQRLVRELLAAFDVPAGVLGIPPAFTAAVDLAAARLARMEGGFPAGQRHRETAREMLVALQRAGLSIVPTAELPQRLRLVTVDYEREEDPDVLSGFAIARCVCGWITGVITDEQAEAKAEAHVGTVRAARHCWCALCEVDVIRHDRAGDPIGSLLRTMRVCNLCGDKRCPRAAQHDQPCQTGRAEE